ncbi:MAG: T9SS type A sorting domain-containing protein [Bacteroidota bacterium]
MKTLSTRQKFAVLLGILVLFCSIKLPAQILRKDSVLSYQFQSATDSSIIGKEVCTYNNFEGTNTCFNFSICTYSAWDPFNRSWDLKSRVEKKIDDNGKRRYTVYANYNPAEKKWINSRKDVEYEDPANWIREFYEWDILNHRWMFQAENILKFDKSKNVTLRQDRNFRKEEGIWYGFKEEFVYDQNGYVIEETNANWSAERNVWEPNNRSTYELDTDGNRLVERHFVWDIFDQKWINTIVRRNTYDSRGRLIKVSSANTSGNNRYEEEYTYNAWGSELTFTSFNSVAGSTVLEPGRRREQTYNTENRLILSENFYWNSDSSIWSLEDKLEINYDMNSREIQRQYYFLSREDTAIRLIAEELKEYSPTGNLLKEISYEYNEEGIIRGGYRTDFEYDAQNRQIAQDRWRWNRDSMAFIPDRRFVTVRDERGAANQYQSFNWDIELAKWFGISIVGWSETEDRRLRHFYQGIWNPNTEEWFINRSSLTYMSPCQQEQAFAAPESELRYYPNPVHSGVLTLEMPIDQSYSLELMDLQGRVVHKSQVEGPFAEVELNVTSSGVYLIRIKNETEEILDRIIVTNP